MSDAPAADPSLLDAASAAYRDAAVAPPSAGLADTVMRTVRGELRSGRPLPVHSDAGPAYATDTAIGNALRAVLDDQPGIVVRRCQVEAGLDGGALAVRMTVALSWDYYTAGADDVLRIRAAEVLRRLFDLPLGRVDLDVVDVLTEDVLTEDVLTEDVLTEDVLTEDVLTEDVLTEDVLTEDGLTEDGR